MVALPGEPGPSLEYRREPLSRGELYTIVTNKDGHGGKGTLVAIIEGVKAVEVSSILRKLPRQARHRVLEITLDMSSTMHAIARECFPNAEQVIDRFHVQKLARDALQELRIQHRWEAINEETNEMENARLEGRKYRARKFRNGETRKEILFRSRLLLFKDPAAWNVKQKKEGFRAFRVVSRHPKGVRPGTEVEKNLFLVQVRGGSQAQTRLVVQSSQRGWLSFFQFRGRFRVRALDQDIELFQQQEYKRFRRGIQRQSSKTSGLNSGACLTLNFFSLESLRFLHEKNEIQNKKKTNSTLFLRPPYI